MEWGMVWIPSSLGLLPQSHHHECERPGSSHLQWVLTEAHRDQREASGGGQVPASGRRSWLRPFHNRRILSGAQMMSWGCLHAFAKVNAGKTLMVERGN